MAGTGKRADQRKTLVLNLYGNDYFGRDKKLRRKQSKKLQEINIHQILENLSSFIKSKKAEINNGAVVINLKGYKILGFGEAAKKLIISASAASKSAIDKIKKAGGDIIIK